MLANRLFLFFLLAQLFLSILAPWEFSADTLIQLVPVLDFPSLVLCLAFILIVVLRQKRSIGFVIVLLLQISLLAFRNMDSQTDHSAQGESVRVLTLNVQQFGRDSSKVDEVINGIIKWDPDIVLLQEFGMHHNWPDVNSGAMSFSRELEMPFYHFKPQRDDIYGVALFSRLALDTADMIFQSYPSTNEVYKYILKAGKQRIKIFNNHLESYNFSTTDDDLDSLTLTEILRKRHNQTAQVLSLVSDNNPTIIAGDFNSIPGTFTHAQMDHKMTNVQSSFGKGLLPTLKNTWLRLDHIWVDDNWVIEQVNLDSSFPSDHNAVIADLVLVR